MTRHALLDNVEHRDLRVCTARGLRWGDGVMQAPTFAAEFRNLQTHYPIVFRRAPDGGFQPFALFGFSEGQNLFLGEGGWDADYIPLAVERQPFLVGMDPAGEPLVHVDLDHPRIGGEGEPLFLAHGGVTAYLQRASSVLRTLHEGIAATLAFVEALRALDLLESFVFDAVLADGTSLRLAGFHAIDEERLRGLDGAALGGLHAAGHLEPIYMAVASVSNFRSLVERLNRSRAAGR